MSDMGLDGSSGHRAFYEPEAGGTWRGGCESCQTSFSGATQEGASSWAMGHDSAVARQRSVAGREGEFFSQAGPGDVPTLGDLRRLIDEAIDRFGGDLVEVLQPADRPPWLYLWTPPSEEGWKRERLGGFHLAGSGEFAPEPNADARAGTPRCEQCGKPGEARSSNPDDPWFLCHECNDQFNQAGVE